jgi:hypothetical protein
MNRIFQYLVIVCMAIAASSALHFGPALAHTGSPAFTIFSNGQTLTASALNANFAHLHNTLAGGITDANIAPNAAISASKIASNPLVPRAMGFAGTRTGNSGGGNQCVGPAGGVRCPGVQVGAEVWTKAGCSDGCYEIRLGFTPKNQARNLVVQTTPENMGVFCKPTVNTDTPTSITVNCYTVFGDTMYNAAFNFVIWES